MNDDDSIIERILADLTGGSITTVPPWLIIAALITVAAGWVAIVYVGTLPTGG